MQHIPYSQESGRSELQAVVPAGTTTDPVAMTPGVERLPSVSLYPGAGGSALVEYTTSPRAEVEAGTARWIAWPHGDVDTDTSDVLLGPVTALRCTATTADAVWEVLA